MIKQVYSLQQKVIEYKRYIFDNNGIPIFMIHHVNSYNDKNRDNLTISTEVFRDFIYKLIDSGYVFLSPNQLKDSIEKKACMITFDDVCKDAIDNAIPLLEKNRIAYVCFISPSFIGKDDYLTDNDLACLKESNLCTIGAHGINHKIFRLLNYNEKKMELSREQHERILGCKISDFAFPFGSVYACDSISIEHAKQEYSRVYSTVCAKTSFKDMSNAIPRINLNTAYVSNNVN